ncbi:hypothetical protein [Synechococcus sp. H55.10]|uniref:hypothetical protein n=1 Tax=Synechococcus sp. H55.10 TaxID=2964503 RepID=UPI0039C75318
MQAAGISTWRELRQKAKLSRGALNALRTGQAEKLKLADLNRAASILQVPLPSLIQDFSGIELVQDFSGIELALEPAETAQEVQRLHKQLEQQEGQLRHQIRAELVEKLKPLLMQYPTLQQVVQRRPDYPAQQVLALLTCLGNLLEDWQLETIGQVWQQVAYDPESHQADEEDIQAGEPVYVRFVGYRLRDQVLVRAKVSRTLPSLAA